MQVNKESESKSELNKEPEIIGDFQTVLGIAIKFIGVDKDIIIPNTIKGLTPGIFKGLAINSVEFEEGSPIKTIPIRAFLNCTQLHIIKLGSLVTKVATEAFCGCISLKKVLWAIVTIFFVCVP